MPVDEVHRLINAVDNNKTEFNSPLFISKQLRKLLEISEPSTSIDELQQKIESINKQQTEDMNKKIESINKQQTEDMSELKQQMENIQKLLNNLIKNSNISHDDDIKDKNDDKIDDKVDDNVGSKIEETT
jgi:hypothetical protein